MNTDKLKQLVEKIREVESRVQTQKHLQVLNQTLQQVSSQPQEPNHQNALAEHMAKFQNAMELFENRFSPQDYQRLLELSEETFSREIPHDIKVQIEENPMSPNVVREFVNQLHSTRAQAFQNLNQLGDSMGYFEFGYEEPEEGSAELGFQIPRAMFEDNLEGLIAELNQIKRMVRFVSEATVGSYDPPRIGSISTTDPLIFLGVAVEVATYFAGTVTWAIGVWYGVEKIRKVRAETAQIEAFSEKEVADIFDKKIQAQIDQSVDTKVKEILKEGNPPKGREGDLEGSLKWVLESLLAKMERGLTIELRLPPPPEPEVDDEGEDIIDEEALATHEQLVEVQKQLVFPEPSADPVLSIPKLDDEDVAS